MKARFIGTAVIAAVTAALIVAFRRVGPRLAERGMKKCHEMMTRMGKECPPGQSAQHTSEGAEKTTPSNASDA